ncbi:MAG: urease accessory protein UreE [Ferruginibacter sp.]
MLVKEKIGNINFFAISNRRLDYLLLEWYETNKRILHKTTVEGVDVSMKFMNGNPMLREGDIIYEDDFSIIVVEIKECDALIIRPKTMFEMASVCYEIGNKHIPLFYQDDELLIAFEQPLYKLLLASGFEVLTGKRKLIAPLRTSVTPHGASNSGTLFSRIMKLTNPPG